MLCFYNRSLGLGAKSWVGGFTFVQPVQRSIVFPGKGWFIQGISGRFLCNFWWLTRPGKHTQSYGKSQSLIGKSTINYQRVYVIVGSEKNLLK